MEKTLLLTYLDRRRAPLAGDEETLRLHRTLCEQTPELYLALLADTTSHLSHKREILLNLLQQSAARSLTREQMLQTLSCLPVSQSLAVLEGIHAQRINGSRARDLVLAFLLGHEQFVTLAATRKQYVTRLIRHALGERSWSAARRFLTHSTPEGEAFLRRELLRFASEERLPQVREALCFLAGIAATLSEPVLLKSQAARKDIEQGSGLPDQTLLGLRGIYYPKFPLKQTLALAAPRSVAMRTDGSLTSLYKEAWQVDAGPQGKTSADQDGPTSLSGAVTGLALAERVQVQVAQDVEALPIVQGRLGIVLDLSASMLSSGERAAHPAALALALVRLLQARVDEVILRQVGPETLSLDALPRPEGATDLATALLDVVAQQPALILLLTDGYENLRPGDIARMLEGLHQLGVTTPIYQVVPVFTAAENLAQRTLSPRIPVLPLTHESGMRELLVRMLLAGAEETLSVETQEQLLALLL